MLTRVVDPLAYRSVTVSVSMKSPGVFASAEGDHVTVVPAPVNAPVSADHV